MTKEIKILVACGSGVATSTIAQEAVKEIAQRAGVNAGEAAPCGYCADHGQLPPASGEAVHERVRTHFRGQ